MAGFFGKEKEVGCQVSYRQALQDSKPFVGAKKKPPVEYCLTVTDDDMTSTFANNPDRRLNVKHQLLVSMMAMTSGTTRFQGPK